MAETEVKERNHIQEEVEVVADSVEVMMIRKKAAGLRLIYLKA